MPFLLVVINNLDVVSLTVSPDEADSILLIDPDDVLVGSIAFQQLQPIATDLSKVIQACRSCQFLQPP